MSEDKRDKVVAALASEHGLASDQLIEVWQRIARAIENEFGTSIADSGVGLGYADLGFQHGGVRFAVRIHIDGQKPAPH